MNTKPRPHSEMGFTLVELIVVMGILGIISVGLTTYVARYLESSSRLEAANDLEDLKRRIRAEFDCRTSINPRPPACNAPSGQDLMDLYDKRGRLILTSTGVEDTDWRGTYHLRAKCVTYPTVDPKQRAIQIEFRRETAFKSNTPAKNIMKKVNEDWLPMFEIPTCTLSLF